MSDAHNPIDVAANRILAIAQTTQPDEAIVHIRRLLAQFSMEQVFGFQRLTEANVYYECERIAKDLGASDVAREIREAGKLDEVSVTECGKDDIRG